MWNLKFRILPDSQRSPEKIAWQEQVPSMHVPPFKHGSSGEQLFGSKFLLKKYGQLDGQ